MPPAMDACRENPPPSQMGRLRPVGLRRAGARPVAGACSSPLLFCHLCGWRRVWDQVRGVAVGRGRPHWASPLGRAGAGDTAQVLAMHWFPSHGLCPLPRMEEARDAPTPGWWLGVATATRLWLLGPCQAGCSPLEGFRGGHLVPSPDSAGIGGAGSLGQVPQAPVSPWTK